MITYFKSRSTHFVFLILLVVSIQLMSLSLRYPSLATCGWQGIEFIVAPVQKFFNEVFQTSGLIWRRYVWLQDTSLERDLLNLQVKELTTKNAQLQELKLENNQLREILLFKKTVSKDGIVSTVVGRDPSAWLRSVNVDKGTSSGVMVGMPVVTGVGVVGRVIATSKEASSILLINDPSSSIGAMLQTSRATGLLEGWLNNDNLKLNYIESLKEESVTIGDKVITSGMDGVFPKGLILGEVIEINEVPGELFRDVIVKPAVDLGTLETVFILPVIPENQLADKSKLNEK